MGTGGAGTILVVGGGLAGCLLAARVRERAPNADLRLLEAGPALGGEHTWSFHDADLKPSYYRGAVLDPGFVKPMARAAWAEHEVRFPGGTRRLSGGYHSLRSADLHAQLAPLLGERLRLGTPVRELSARGVVTARGEDIAAACVVDARGPRPFAAGSCAFQTFFGLVVETAAAHGLTRPILMDATVPQRGGFRFVYVLPFSPKTLLVEDTRYSDSPTVDEAGARAYLPLYLRQLGVDAYRETGSEHGALAIPLAHARRPEPVPGTVAVGAGAGLFHPTTGYSLRAAALSADLFAQAVARGGVAGLAPFFDDFNAARWRAAGFYRRLNNMLFMAADAGDRWRVMAKFYGLGERCIERFYAQELTLLDRARLLTGRPPVPVARGLRAFFAGVARA